MERSEIRFSDGLDFLSRRSDRERFTTTTAISSCVLKKSFCDSEENGLIFSYVSVIIMFVKVDRDPLRFQARFVSADTGRNTGKRSVFSYQ